MSYPCTGMQRILFWVEKILVTTSLFLLVPCSEMMMDLWMSARENSSPSHQKSTGLQGPLTFTVTS